jgi:HAMP domain-containing protein
VVLVELDRNISGGMLRAMTFTEISEICFKIRKIIFCKQMHVMCHRVVLYLPASLNLYVRTWSGLVAANSEILDLEQALGDLREEWENESKMEKLK